MNMAVTVTLNESSNTLEFHAGNGADDKEIAGYLCKLVQDNRTVSKSRGALAAKVKLADTVLNLRKAQQEKMELLAKAAETWEERSRDWSLSPEIRSLNSDRARKAREECRKIAVELGG